MCKDIPKDTTFHSRKFKQVYMINSRMCSLNLLTMVLLWQALNQSKWAVLEAQLLQLIYLCEVMAKYSFVWE